MTLCRVAKVIGVHRNRLYALRDGRASSKVAARLVDAFATRMPEALS
jgi:plasmid maintenance system antidote protein VapI